MASFEDEFAQLKKSANIAFAENDFTKAEELYTELLEKFTDRERAIILTNRSITRFTMNKFQESLEDADAAIAIDKHWMKAYYRKALALEKLGKPKDCFDAWSDAAMNCDVNSSPWLSEKIVHARDKWVKAMKTVPVVDENDFFDRYALLTDVRDRLSTLAHLWNGAYSNRRCLLNMFFFFLNVFSYS
jgi:tetratricopeptide (TPR) repeat protein